MPKATEAAVKKALKPFQKPALGTDALEKYEIDPKTKLPKIVLKMAGGKSSLKNTAMMKNVFYAVPVGDETFYVHYQIWQPNKREWDPGGEAMSAFDDQGNVVGSCDAEKKKISWQVHFEE